MSTVELQTAVNRLLPYRALQTDLPAHEGYYTFNDPTVEALIAGAGTDWTEGTDALAEPVGVHDYDGNGPLQVNEAASVTNSPDVYIESAAANLDSALPCTFRVIVKAGSTQWIRIFDPNDADTDLWLEAQSTDTAAILGDVGSDVIEARVIYPPPGLVAGGIGSGGGASGQHNGYSICEFELPAAASRTIRIQLVDSNGATVLNGTGNVIYIAEAEVLNGKVSQWTCRRTGRTFSQATPANQPFARPMGVRRFNGRRVLLFDSSRFTRLVSDDVAGDWEFLHDGSGASVFIGWQPVTGGSSNQVLVTSRSILGDVGMSCVYDATLDRLEVTIEDTLSAEIVASNTPSSSLPPDTFYVAALRFQDNDTADFAAEVGGESLSVANVDYSSAAGDPGLTLTIGSSYDGYIADVAIYSDRLTDDEHERAIEELEAQSATSGSIPGNILWVRYDQGVTESVGVVTALADISPENQTIVPASTDPAFVESSPAFRGSEAVVFDDPANSFSCAAVGAALTGQVERCVIATSLMAELNTSGNASWLWQLSGASGGSFEGVDQASSSWFFLRRDNGGSTDFLGGSSADVRPHTHSYVSTDGTDVLTWIDGEADINTTSNKVLTLDNFQWSLPGSTGGDYAGTELAVYDAAPTTYQRQLVERAQRRRMLGMLSLKLGFSLGRATAAPAVWSPPNSGALALDLLAGTYDLGAGGDIARWHDISGAGNHAENPTTANQPTPLVAGLDGKACVQFIKANLDWLEIDSLAAALSGSNTPFTFAVYGQIDTLSSNGTILGGGNTASATVPNMQIQYPKVNAAFHRMFRLGDSGSSRDVDTSGELDAAGTQRTFLMTFDGSIVALRVDGVALAGYRLNGTPVAPAGALWNTEDCTFNTLTLGAWRRSGGATNAWNGRIRRVNLWPGVVLSGADIADWETNVVNN